MAKINAINNNASVFTSDTSITATLGNITATQGDLISTLGNITATHGNITATLGDIVLTNGKLNVGGSTGTTGQVLTAATGANPSWATPTPTVAWSEATASMNAVANNGYITKIAVPGLLTYTLPATAAQGSIIEITGFTAGGWKLAQNAGQSVNFGALTTTPGVGGYLASAATYDSIRIVCVTADTVWNVLSSQGNITVV
jgi:hypothetical protein